MPKPVEMTISDLYATLKKLISKQKKNYTEPEFVISDNIEQLVNILEHLNKTIPDALLTQETAQTLNGLLETPDDNGLDSFSTLESRSTKMYYALIATLREQLSIKDHNELITLQDPIIQAITASTTDFNEFVSILTWLPTPLVLAYLHAVAPQFGSFFKQKPENFMVVIEVTRFHKAKYPFMNLVKSLLPEIFTTINSLQHFFATFEKSITIKEQMITGMFNHIDTMINSPEDFLIALDFMKYFKGLIADEPIVIAKKIEFINKLAKTSKIEPLITSDCLEAILKSNDKSVCTHLVAVLGNPIVTKAKTYAQLYLLFQQTISTSHSALISLLTPEQLSLINKENAREFFQLLHNSSVDKSSVIKLIAMMGEQLAELYSNFAEFAGLLNIFDAEEKKLIYSTSLKKMKSWISAMSLAEFIDNHNKVFSDDFKTQLLDDCCELLFTIIKNGHQMMLLLTLIDVKHRRSFFKSVQPQLPILLKCPSVLSELIDEVLMQQLNPVSYLKGIEHKLPQIITRSRHLVKVLRTSDTEYQSLLLDIFKSRLPEFTRSTKRMAAFTEVLKPSNAEKMATILKSDSSEASTTAVDEPSSLNAAVKENVVPPRTPSYNHTNVLQGISSFFHSRKKMETAKKTANAVASSSAP